MQKITPFLWFDGKAEEAVNFHTPTFKNSRIVSVARQSGRDLGSNERVKSLDRPRPRPYYTVWLRNPMAKYHTSPDHLSTTFGALADPTRRAILSRLASGEASVTELAKPFDMSLPGISKHLKVLQRAGLIARSRRAQWRPCRLQAGPLKEIDDWVEHYRRFFDESFDRLDEYLSELKEKEKKHGRKRK